MNWARCALFWLVLVLAGCGDVVEVTPAGVTEEPETLCFLLDSFGYAYSGPLDGYERTVPGEELCIEGSRDLWCIYETDGPEQETREWFDAHAVPDPENPEWCLEPSSPGIGGMGGWQ